MGRIKTTKNQGMVLPLVIMISILLLAGVLALSVQSKVTARNTENLSKKFTSDATTDAMIQKGLSVLSKRISYLPNRIKDGVTDNNIPGGKRFISNDDIDKYVNQSPASFWTEWMNNIPNEPPFSLENSETVSFEVDTTTTNLKIKIVSAVNAATAQAENTAGYNNVTLRYGYQITATNKVSGKTETIVSSLRAEHTGAMIQIHLVRELSRYNLFTINNTTRGGQPLYDRTSYTGGIYSNSTYYVSGTGANEPRYSDVIEISKLASPPVVHKDGISFQFKYPNGTPNPPFFIDPVALPSSVAMDDQKALSHKMNVGQNPLAATTNGIYVGTTSVQNMVLENSIFVRSGGATTTLLISSIGSGSTRYTVTLNGVTREVNQNTNLIRGFLIFVDGPLSISGTLAEGTKLTVNATQTILITNSLQYESGAMSPDTVLGLVSWQGDILVAKNIPPDAGQAVKNLNLHGVIMTIDGAFGVEGAEDLAGNYPAYVGTINHKGAFIRKWGLPTLSPDGSRGWGLVSAYDPYLKETKAPPFFPGNGRYKIVDESLSKVVDLFFRKS